MGIRLGVCPLTQSRLYEPLCFSVGSRSVRSCPDVPQTKLLVGLAKRLRDVAGAIVGHDSFNSQAQSAIISHRRLEKRHSAFLAFVTHDFNTGDPGMVIHVDVNIFPSSDASGVPSVPCDAMSDLCDSSELLDVDVEELAGLCPPVALWRLLRRQAFEPAELQFMKGTKDRAARDAGCTSDLLTRPALTT